MLPTRRNVGTIHGMRSLIRRSLIVVGCILAFSQGVALGQLFSAAQAANGTTPAASPPSSNTSASHSPTLMMPIIPVNASSAHPSNHTSASSPPSNGSVPLHKASTPVAANATEKAASAPAGEASLFGPLAHPPSSFPPPSSPLPSPAGPISHPSYLPPLPPSPSGLPGTYAPGSVLLGSTRPVYGAVHPGIGVASPPGMTVPPASGAAGGSYGPSYLAPPSPTQSSPSSTAPSQPPLKTGDIVPALLLPPLRHAAGGGVSPEGASASTLPLSLTPTPTTASNTPPPPAPAPAGSESILSLKPAGPEDDFKAAHPAQGGLVAEPSKPVTIPTGVSGGGPSALSSAPLGGPSTPPAGVGAVGGGVGGGGATTTPVLGGGATTTTPDAGALPAFLTAHPIPSLATPTSPTTPTPTTSPTTTPTSPITTPTTTANVPVFVPAPTAPPARVTIPSSNNTEEESSLQLPTRLVGQTIPKATGHNTSAHLHEPSGFNPLESSKSNASEIESAQTWPYKHGNATAAAPGNATPRAATSEEETGHTNATADAASLAERRSKCTDVSPGVRHTCEQQRLFGKCDAVYMVAYNFCAKTCGRAPCAKCEDMKPPKSDYSCEDQAKFGKCNATWMVEGNYCAKSCNRHPCPPSEEEKHAASVKHSEEGGMPESHSSGNSSSTGFGGFWSPARLAFLNITNISPEPESTHDKV